MKLKRLDENRLLLEREGDMRVEAVIYANQNIKVENESLSQLRNATLLPPVKKVLATPDIHTGYGVPIGSVVGLKDHIMPSAVGYDINCGMRLIATPLKKENIDIKTLAHSLRRDIPLGEGKDNIRLPKESLREVLNKGIRGFREIVKETPVAKLYNDEEYENDMSKIEEQGSMGGFAEAVSSRAIDRGKNQLGTLGGGNHFIEIQLVTSIGDYATAEKFGIFKGQIVVMIHSGSRGFGHQIGDDYMPLAAQISKGMSPDRTLGFFHINSDEGKKYIGAMRAAANFAFVNRQVMAMLIRKNFRYYHGNIPMPLIYDVPHNIAKLELHQREEIWVHRKGATRAFPAKMMRGTPFYETGQPVLIPGSMGTASYLLVGTNQAEESLYSVNHGAGRTMSRTAAAGKIQRRSGKVIKEAAISDDRFKESMKGIYLECEDSHTIKEEAPDAYKDIDEVINVVVGAGLAKIVARMVPLAVLKG